MAAGELCISFDIAARGLAPVVVADRRPLEDLEETAFGS